MLLSAPEGDQLLTMITEQAAKAEADGQIGHEVISALDDAGVTRMAVSQELGGYGTPIGEILEVIVQIGRSDASTAWVAGVYCTADIIFAHLPADTRVQVYAQRGPGTLGAGAVAPKGTATPAAGGYVINGRWPFVSGCRHASWIYLQCVLTSPGETSTLAQRPRTITAVVPRNAVKVLDTWQVMGLRGTGSDDVEVDEVFCAEGFTCSIFDDVTTDPHPLYRIPLLDQLGVYLAAAALGNARAAIDDIRAWAIGGKRSAFDPRRLALSPGFRDRLGGAYLELESAWSLLHGQATQAWKTADSGGTWSNLDRAVLRATSTTVIQAARAVTTTAFDLGGGNAIYTRSPLQRRLRDAQAMSLHAVAGRAPFEIVGGILAGADVSSLLF